MRVSKFTPEGYIVREINPLNIMNDIQRIDRIREAKGIYEELVKYLKKRLIGKVCSFPVLGKDRNGSNEIHGANHWTIENIYLDDKHQIHFVESKNKYDVILHIGSGITNRIYYEDKADPITPYDPYGEEEWEYESVVNENKKDLYVGDKVRIVLGNNRTVLTIRYEGRFGVITDFRNNRTQFKVDLDPSEHRRNWNVGIWFESENLEKVKKISKKNIKRIKQIKYKNRFIDPYGEEDWENENEAFENEPDFEVGDKVLVTGYVGSRNFGYISGYITKKILGKVVRTDIAGERVGSGPNCHYYSGYVYYVDTIKYWVSPWNLRKTTEKKEKGRIRWYGKGKLDDWENENEGLKIEHLYVRITSKEEYNEVINFLHSNGFVWGGSGGNLTKWKTPWYDDGSYRGYICPQYDQDDLINNDKRVFQSRDAGKEANIVSAEDFMNNFKKKDRIRWYHKGNLVNENKGDMFDVGEILIYNGRNFPDRVGEEVIVTQSERGSAVHYRFLNDGGEPWKEHPCDVEYLKRPEVENAKIRWYKKGKFVNEALKGDFNVGDRVIFHIGPGFFKSGTGRKKELEGLTGKVIGFEDGNPGIEFDINIDDEFGFGHSCDGFGREGYCYWVSPEYLTKVEEEIGKIRWYKKGKFHSESMTTSFRDFHNL